MQAFHISTGVDGHRHFKMRKALRKWVARAHVRRGLRKQVFTSAIRGKEVMRRAQGKRRALGPVTLWMTLALVAREQGVDMHEVASAIEADHA